MSVLFTKAEGDHASTEIPQWASVDKWEELTCDFFKNDPVVHVSGGSEFYIFITGKYLL
jgi:hypothetical protein